MEDNINTFTLRVPLGTVELVLLQIEGFAEGKYMRQFDVCSFAPNTSDEEKAAALETVKERLLKASKEQGLDGIVKFIDARPPYVSYDEKISRLKQ